MQVFALLMYHYNDMYSLLPIVSMLPTALDTTNNNVMVGIVHPCTQQ